MLKRNMKLGNLAKFMNGYLASLVGNILQRAFESYRNYTLSLSSDKGALLYILRHGKRISSVALALKKKTLFNKINLLLDEKISMTLQELESVINDITPRPDMVHMKFETPNLPRLKELQQAQDELAEEIESDITKIMSTY